MSFIIHDFSSPFFKHVWEIFFTAQLFSFKAQKILVFWRGKKFF